MYLQLLILLQLPHSLLNVLLDYHKSYAVQVSTFCDLIAHIKSSRHLLPERVLDGKADRDLPMWVSMYVYALYNTDEWWSETMAILGHCYTEAELMTPYTMLRTSKTTIFRLCVCVSDPCKERWIRYFSRSHSFSLHRLV